MESLQFPSDITSLDDYIAAHGLPTTDAENPDAPHLRGNARVPGGMSGVVLYPAHETQARLLVSAVSAVQSILARMVDTTTGRECNCYDEALVHAEHVLDHARAAIRARDEALRLAAAE